MSGIVVGFDGSEAGRYAVAWATREADLRAQPLRIVHALQSWLYETPSNEPSSQVARWARKDAEALLEDAVEEARKVSAGPEISTEILSGDARPALVAAAKDAAMLVVGGRGEGGFAGLLLGSVAYGVVGRPDCPVVVVQGAPGTPTGQVVAGVDASQSSIAALEAAFSEAAAREATLRAIYARPKGDSAEAIYGMRLDEGEARDQVVRAFAPLADRFPTVTVVDEVAEGHPVGALVRASKEADLLVVGRRGRGGYANLRLGSVSRGVLHHAHCPVMVVSS
jgi:nucleotide-binding universal stress UspA family protein